MSFAILGTGKKVPQKILTNKDLSEMVDTDNEWIVGRTGIENRHIATTETMTEMCIEAAESALENAGVKPEELDLIICATIRGDYLTPSQACVIQQGIGATCIAFDVNAACSGFIYALDLADSYFISGKAEKILIVAFEMMSKLIDWNDRNTCVLFGDGGGAVVLGKGDDLLAIKLTASGNTELLSIPNLNGECPFGESVQQKQILKMNGSEVFKFAVNGIINELETVIIKADLDKDDIDYVVLHQANMRIISLAKQKLGMKKAIFVSNLANYGNTSAGSIPILLDEMNRGNMLKKGQLIAFVAFGGGLTTGACVLRWSKD
ncbi:MAG: beta-ketoacyl-ACP synthase III [Saccharofermentanales bacterium]